MVAARPRVVKLGLLQKQKVSFEISPPVPCEALKAHLENLHVVDCFDTLTKNYISMENLGEMTEEDLRDAGILSGPIRIILNARNKVRGWCPFGV